MSFQKRLICALLFGFRFCANWKIQFVPAVFPSGRSKRQESIKNRCPIHNLRHLPAAGNGTDCHVLQFDAGTGDQQYASHQIGHTAVFSMPSMLQVKQGGRILLKYHRDICLVRSEMLFAFGFQTPTSFMVIWTANCCRCRYYVKSKPSTPLSVSRWLWTSNRKHSKFHFNMTVISWIRWQKLQLRNWHIVTHRAILDEITWNYSKEWKWMFLSRTWEFLHPFTLSPLIFNLSNPGIITNHCALG